jgi:hypothetical protein
MNPDDILKAAPEIAKVVAPVAAAIPFTGIVKKMLGPAADEVAEMLRDRVRLYRYGNQMRCIEKAEKMARDAGFTPKAVPPKILFPLLEGASFEEDENLHKMWAALLANAAANISMAVRPTFISILKDLAPDEAYLLKAFDDACAKITPTAVLWAGTGELERHLNIVTIVEPRNGFPEIEGELFDAKNVRYDACIDLLKAKGLITISNGPIQPFYILTAFGRSFVEACTPPKPKA